MTPKQKLALTRPCRLSSEVHTNGVTWRDGKLQMKITVNNGYQ